METMDEKKIIIRIRKYEMEDTQPRRCLKQKIDEKMYNQIGEKNEIKNIYAHTRPNRLTRLVMVVDVEC